MPDKEKDSYEVLIERIDALQKDLDATKASLKEMTDFNRALLARAPGINQESHSDTKEKFDKYLKGE